MSLGHLIRTSSACSSYNSRFICAFQMSNMKAFRQRWVIHTPMYFEAACCAACTMANETTYCTKGSLSPVRDPGICELLAGAIVHDS